MPIDASSNSNWSKTYTAVAISAVAATVCDIDVRGSKVITVSATPTTANVTALTLRKYIDKGADASSAGIGLLATFANADFDTPSTEIPWTSYVATSLYQTAAAGTLAFKLNTEGAQRVQLDVTGSTNGTITVVVGGD